MIKKRISALCLCLLLLLASGCATEKRAAEPKTLVVFAAASLTETLTELGDRYMAEHKGVKLVYNFDSSGTLQRQLAEGAACDVFLSAGQKQMNALEGKDGAKASWLLDGSRFNILENEVVLAVPRGNPKHIQSYRDLAARLGTEKILLAVGNADVPVGQYTQRLLKFFGLDEKVLAEGGKITYGSNVKEVTTQVSEGVVDAGIIYRTDAAAAQLAAVDTATPEMCGQVIYPAAILKGSRQQAEARAYLAFLQSPAAGEVFRKAGFTPLK